MQLKQHNTFHRTLAQICFSCKIFKERNNFLENGNMHKIKLTAFSTMHAEAQLKKCSICKIFIKIVSINSLTIISSQIQLNSYFPFARLSFFLIILLQRAGKKARMTWCKKLLSTVKNSEEILSSKEKGF